MKHPTGLRRMLQVLSQPRLEENPFSLRINEEVALERWVFGPFSGTEEDGDLTWFCVFGVFFFFLPYDLLAFLGIVLYFSRVLKEIQTKTFLLRNRQ